MKKLVGFVIFFLLTAKAIHAEESLAIQAQQARALAQANDFNQAGMIYDQLLKQPLPQWQRALVIYNLGTTKIFQQQWESALQLFHTIPLASVSSPLLIRSLYQNEGAAYLGRIWSLAAVSPDLDLDQQLDMATQGLRKILEAIRVNCHMQQLEEKMPSSFTCQPSWDLTLLLIQIRSQINDIKDRQRDLLLKTEEISAIILLLKQGIEQLISPLQLMEEAQQSSHYQNYLVYQAQALLPVWKRIDEGTFSPEELQQKKEASEAYQKGLQALKQGQFSQSLVHFHSSLTIQKLGILSAKDQLLFNYRLLLINELTVTSIQNLLNIQQKLMIDKKDQEGFKTANHDLEISLAHLQDNQLLLARFFLIAGYVVVKDLLDQQPDSAKQEKLTPLFILKNALQQAQQSLWLTRLFNLLEETKENKQDQLMKIIRERQVIVAAQADPFIKVVLTSEKELFASEKAEVLCQKSPWDEVIPLFEQGDQAAQKAFSLLSKNPPLDLFQVISNQEQTVHYWRRALQILEQSSSSSSAQPENQSSSDKEQQSDSESQQQPKNINEILRLIQEMQLQDQPQQKGIIPQELHTW